MKRHLLQPPPSLSRHQGLGYCCLPAGCWGRSARGAVGAQHCHSCFSLLNCTHYSGLWLSAGAEGHLEKYWLSCYSVGGLGKCKRHRSIIIPCFLTPCHHTIVSSLWGRRGMHRSIRQAGDVTLWTQTSRNYFLGTRQHCIVLLMWDCLCDGNQGWQAPQEYTGLAN